jgi:two-component system nitrogen regulation response regulator NtrX
MSLKMQAKVLRALQEQVIEPVGGQGSVRVDVRVIAATNKDLGEEILHGRFREDLFFRLNVIPVFVPPLRDRGEDILRLADHFVREFAREYGRRPKGFAGGARERLSGYPWRGNVRELRNVTERLVIMVPGDEITAADLSFLQPPPAPGNGREGAGTVVAPLYEARDGWERAHILNALGACENNISRTADALGLERSHLYKKMKGLGIAPARERDD